MLPRLRARSDYRSTQLRNQLTSLVLYEAITTTSSQAGNLAAFANRFFRQSRGDNLTARRRAHQTLLDKNAVKKLFGEIFPRYSRETTNFLRVLKVAPRRGDAAEQSIVFLTKTLKESGKTEKTDAATAKN